MLLGCRISFICMFMCMLNLMLLRMHVLILVDKAVFHVFEVGHLPNGIFVFVFFFFQLSSFVFFVSDMFLVVIFNLVYLDILMVENIWEMLEIVNDGLEESTLLLLPLNNSQQFHLIFQVFFQMLKHIRLHQLLLTETIDNRLVICIVKLIL